MSSPGLMKLKTTRPMASSQSNSSLVSTLAVTLSSPDSSGVLFDINFKIIGGTEMADVEQTQNMIPFTTCEISLCQHVCELVLGVNVFDLDFWIQIDSTKQPIKSNSVGSGNMSHRRASSLYDHLDHCFVVFKHIQQSFLMRRVDV